MDYNKPKYLKLKRKFLFSRKYQDHIKYNPAVIYNDDDNTEVYIENEKVHRDPLKGPAVIARNGQSYYVNGKLHNPFGPARVGRDCLQYFLNGKDLTEEEFKKEQEKYKWELI
jgi:hypothetical protein